MTVSEKQKNKRRFAEKRGKISRYFSGDLVDSFCPRAVNTGWRKARWRQTCNNTKRNIQPNAVRERREPLKFTKTPWKQYEFLGGSWNLQKMKDFRHNCDGDLELMAGFEPATYWLRISCSTSWATPAWHFSRNRWYHTFRPTSTPICRTSFRL